MVLVDGANDADSVENSCEIMTTGVNDEINIYWIDKNYEIGLEIQHLCPENVIRALFPYGASGDMTSEGAVVNKISDADKNHRHNWLPLCVVRFYINTGSLSSDCH